MKKELFFDRYCAQQFAALVEDGKLAEFAVEPENRGEIVGNIYKGRVTNVLSGMNAAFICCGLAKNCYLSMEETYTDYTKYDGTPVKTSEKPLDLHVGDEIIVQVTKPPRGNKGAKVTTHLSFVGRRIIYLPTTDFLGISRKITDPTERERLLKTVDKMRGGAESGFIVRTQAPFATLKQLKSEADFLKKVYQRMVKTAADAPVGAVLYQDEDLPVRMLRDCFGEDISAIHVGDEELYRRLLTLVRLRGDLPERKIVFHTGERSMLEEYGIMPLVYDIARPTVPLENGGSIVIEHTEAMTVIDVNTGSFIGDSSLEETVFAVNVAAAKEIARQVRLRNIGGIIVVDFIDMLEEEHRIAVTEELKKYLSADKAKCNVLPMSELCLTQFTRKRVGNDTLSMLVKPCELCEGKGHVPNDIFVFSRIRAAILDCFAEGNTSAVVEINAEVMKKILSQGVFTKEAQGRWKHKRVYFIPHKTYKEDAFCVRGDKERVLHLPDTAQLLY
ncbi:MAG: Rne/Rng family ribonuclease [Clostridia bacterium]|nr:Rne/Rng family ribonuclease [Clostridia bacterium]